MKLSPREGGASIVLIQEHFLSTYLLMQQRKAGKWPIADCLLRASPRSLYLQREIIG